MTVTPLRDRARESAAEVAVEPPGEAHRGEARRRASSLTTLPFHTGVRAREDDAQSRAAKLAGVLAATLTARSDTAPHHWQPRTVAVVWQDHKAAATAHDLAAVKAARYLFGVLHTVLTALAYGLVVVTSTPAALAGVTALALACWLWL